MKNKKISKAEQIEICNLYRDGLKQKEIGKLFGLGQAGVSSILLRNKISNKRGLKEKYFEFIDTKEKAYWLGFIAADGGINKSNQKLTIGVNDLEMCVKFAKSVESEHKIATRQVYDKRTKNYYLTHSIQIGNKEFVSYLNKWGINNNKSEVFNFPEIEEKYYPAFLAGLFDGDGSIYQGSKNKMRMNQIATLEVISYIQSYISNNLNIEIRKISKVSSGNVWKMHLYKDALVYLNFIYQDEMQYLYLSRKYQKYLKFRFEEKSYVYYANKQVVRTNVNGEEMPVFYNSLKEATTAMNGKTVSSISNCLNGRSKTAYGYKWCYFLSYSREDV